MAAEAYKLATAFRASADAVIGAGRLDGQLCWIGGASTAATAVAANVTTARSYVDAPIERGTPPTFDGTPEEFVAAYSATTDDGLAERMRNKIKKCGRCGKPNAYTLSTCNGCGDDLTSVPISTTPNIFMGFVYGIKKGPFPYQISLRHEDESIIVFDDLLSLTRAHLNCVPTDVYVPDFRYLFGQPKEGLRLLERMYDSCFQVLKSQFLEDDAFRASVGAGADTGTDNMSFDVDNDDLLRELVVAGMNYPPSQYQLHLQFMLPPFLPFQWRQCLAGDVHFTPQRFFSYRFLREALLRLIERNQTYTLESVEETIDHFRNELGIDYDVIHEEEVQRAFESHRRLARWDPAGFRYVTVGETVIDLSTTEECAAVEASVTANAVAEADKKTLQNYGRPYIGGDGNEGRPGGTYYKYAKKPNDVRTW